MELIGIDKMELTPCVISHCLAVVLQHFSSYFDLVYCLNILSTIDHFCKFDLVIYKQTSGSFVYHHII